MTTQVEQTLNVTVAQIEDALLHGQSVPDFAREWSEPPANVLAVFRRLQDEGRIPRNAPSQVATKPAAPSLSVLRADARAAVQPRPEFKERATNAVELLARAEHINDRRIQAALGRARKAMTDLAGLVTKYEESSATRARIAELEAELRALRSSNRGGGLVSAAA